MDWQLNRIGYPVYNLGPGRRIAIWTQGCNLACKACISPGMWDKAGGSAVSVDRLVEQVAGIAHEFDGLTISGGEPFAQPGALTKFLHAVKAYTTLEVLVFTGYTLAELEAAGKLEPVAAYIDTLVDGRYEKEKHDGTKLRGSANQTTYHLDAGQAVEVPPLENEKIWSVKVDDDGVLFMSGIPKAGDLKALGDRLARKGMPVSFV